LGKKKEMQDREYLRIKIAGLRVHYDVLPEGGNAPVFLGGQDKGTPAFIGEAIRDCLGEQDAFQKLMVSYLQRIEAKLDQLIGIKEREEAIKLYRCCGEAVDIGGGGISLKTREAHPIGALLDLCIFARYGDPRPIYAVGKICWLEEHIDEDGEAFSIMGVEFVQINEDDRKTIVRLVFQTERKQRRNRIKADE
jgi:hypothetical protein